MIDWNHFMDNDEDYENLVEKLKPEDYYFQLGVDPDGNSFFDITPKGYFDLTGAHLDLNCVADHCVPDRFYELAESSYEYDGDPQVGRQLLLSAGFIEKKMF